MDGRYSYQQQFQVGDPLLYQPAAFEPAPRTFASAVGRFFYRLIVFCLILGAVGGVLFGLYRNDILLTIARGAGMEAQYHSLEQRIGAPGWGTPRSIELPKDVQAAPVAAAPAEATEPHEKTTAEQPSTTVPASATSETKTAETKKSTADGLPILSFDSLPSSPKGAAAAKAEPAPVSLSSLPSTTHRTESRSARAVPVVLKETPTERSVPARASKPAPAPKPEPVAKAEPAPKPEPPAPKVDPTAPRSSDNPLKAAIRASMAGKKTE